MITRKTLFSFALASLVCLSAPVYGGGPIFRHKDGKVDQEFEQVYQDLRGKADAAELDDIGTYVSSVTAAAKNFTTTDQYGDLVTLSLDAGEWDVTGMVEAQLNGATMTNFIGGISTTAGNSGAGLTFGLNAFGAPVPTANYDSTGVVPRYRVSVSDTTTIYLKYRATYSAGTPQAIGSLTARKLGE